MLSGNAFRKSCMNSFGVKSTSYTIADYCKMFKQKELVVNRDYQRSDRVWPPAAKSFLIETILLGYPIPKLSLYQITDVKTRGTIKEIVDGQQRTMAILEFYDNKLSLSQSTELELAAGKTYEELDEELKHQFLAYSLDVDLFTTVTPDQIRETFRRINSYTVPLNPEEHRHAVYQGAMKWFIYKLSKTFDQVLLDIGSFTQKSLVRMEDTKLYCEIIHALLFGISTTTKKRLDDLYKLKDKQFPEDSEIKGRISTAIDVILGLPDIHKSVLMKPYMLYSLILAITHLTRPVPALQDVYFSDGKYHLNNDIALANLTALAEAVESDGENPPFSEFVKASSSKTNVKAQRETRFIWFCKALQPQLL